MPSVSIEQIKEAKIKAEARVRQDFTNLFGPDSEQEHSALLAITYMAEELIEQI